MARIDRVIQFMEERKKDRVTGISAQQIALELGIHRSDASADLNHLFKQGIVTKTGTRPVLYKFKKNLSASEAQVLLKTLPVQSIKGKAAVEKAAFSEIVGYDGSIKAQIELAKAAIVYPPHGLHTLIFGESGVGKNLLAEAMRNYAKECWSKQGSSEVPFVQFCCADYAANEQLLLAQLFGYVKGAFTGADEDHEGVVDRAQGGILFLDEIHRLPPTGQELLFMLIDKGVYRRLGETHENRKSRLMIIGATSEDVSSSLLMTFRRRIPVQITLPRIGERPVRERVNIIIHFVRQEAMRLGISIWISGKVLEVFANYNCPANIGELRNDVLLCCAKSYLEYSAAAAEYLKLEVKNIPQRIFSLVKRQTVLDDSVNRFFQEGILVEPDSMLLQAEQDTTHALHIDLYKYIDRKMEYYRQLGLTAEDMSAKVGQDLEKYFGSVAQILRRTDPPDMPVSIIEEAIWEAANDLLNDAADCLGRSYGRNTLVALAWHLQQFKERFASGRMIFNPNLEYIKTAHSAAFEIVETYRERISEKLGILIPADELGYIAMFLIHGADDFTQAHSGIVIVAHGRGIAQDTAEVANNLLGTDRIKSYDIPLNRSNAQTVEDLCNVIKNVDEGLGVVLLVDMGFLVTMEDTLCQKTGIQVRVIPNVTTALVLEAGKRLLTAPVDLDTAVKCIYDAYDDYVMTTRQRRKRQVLPPAKKAEVRQKAVLLVCATGQGVAQKIKEILLAEIPEMRSMRFVMVGAAEDIQSIAEKADQEVSLIIGSIDPHIPGIPFVHVGDLLVSEGMEKLQRVLQSWKNAPQGIHKFRKYEETYKLLEEQLGKFVKSLPLKEVARQCTELVERIADSFFEGSMEPDGIIRTYLHAACMFDRIHTKEALLEPQWSFQIQKERERDFTCLQKIVTDCGAKLSLQIPIGELCYFLRSLPVKSEKSGLVKQT